MLTYQDVVKRTFNKLKGTKLSPQEKMRRAGVEWKKVKGKKMKGGGMDEEGGGFGSEMKQFGKDVAGGFNSVMKVVKPINKLASMATMGAIPNAFGMIPKL
tara:strand:+ start:3498 stop:3800 length:303 start_codon:yes stop_codon:yes gene_type:complete